MAESIIMLAAVALTTVAEVQKACFDALGAHAVISGDLQLTCISCPNPEIVVHGISRIP